MTIRAGLVFGLMLLIFGGCSSSSPSGGGGDDGTCRSTGCGGNQRCNLSTGLCETTCPNGSDAECPQPGFCDKQSNLCKCAPGNHLCGQSCVADTSTDSCGSSCTPCPVPQGGTATCDGSQCGFSCASPLVACGAACAQCPSGATSTRCEGDRCVASNCPASSRLCDGQCSPCPAGATATSCDGNRCVASGCPGGEHVCNGQCVSSSSTSSCGTSCSACPEPSMNGSATCQAGSCGLDCSSGFTACGTECVSCPSGAGVAASGCSGNSCVATACMPNYKLCSNSCSECPEGATATACTNGCVATSCGLGLSVCNGKCCGLTATKVQGLADNGPVGVVHSASGVPTIAYDYSFYGNSLKVSDWTGSGFSAPSSLGGKDASNLSFARGSDGMLHMAWANRPFNATYSLMYASKPAGGSWSTTTVLSSSLLLSTSLAIAPDGEPRIVVSDNLNDELLYLEKSASGWSAPETVPGIYSAYDFALAIDAQGTSHIVAQQSGIHYVSGRLGSLSAGPVVTTSATAKHAAIIAAGSAPRVAFYDANAVRLSTLASGSWAAPKVVDPVGSATSDAYVALAADASQRLHIAFGGCGQSGCGLRYGIENGSSFSFQTAVSTGGVTYVALSVSSSGQAAAMASTIGDGVYFFHP